MIRCIVYLFLSFFDIYIWFFIRFALPLHPQMKKSMMKAALFDLDGVVFDTEPQYTIFWGEQCREFHPEHPGLEHEIKGQTLVQIYDAWFSGELADKQALITERLNQFEQQMDYQYVAGFEQYIKRLRQEGVKTAVVTSSNQPFEPTEDGSSLSAPS